MNSTDDYGSIPHTVKNKEAIKKEMLQCYASIAGKLRLP